MSLLVRVRVELRATSGKRRRRVPEAVCVCYGSDMFGKQECGVEYYTKVTDVGAPWDDSLMEVDWEKGSKSASGEQDCLSFVDVDS